MGQNGVLNLRIALASYYKNDKLEAVLNDISFVLDVFRVAFSLLNHILVTELFILAVHHARLCRPLGHLQHCLQCLYHDLILFQNYILADVLLLEEVNHQLQNNGNELLFEVKSLLVGLLFPFHEVDVVKNIDKVHHPLPLQENLRPHVLFLFHWVALRRDRKFLDDLQTIQYLVDGVHVQQLVPVLLSLHFQKLDFLFYFWVGGEAY